MKTEIAEMLNTNGNLLIPHWYMYPPKNVYISEPHVPDLRKHLERLVSKVANVYVHIPFCNMKCGFCSLFTTKGHSDGIIQSYVNHLVREIRNFGKHIENAPIEIGILYLGGGTPSLLSERHISEIMNALYKYFDLKHMSAASVEFSPEVTSANIVKNWRKHGFSRASIGVQSFDDGVLSAMKRLHTAMDGMNAISILADAGFVDLNVDLIFGYNQQSSSTWQSDLKTVTDSAATSCTVHPLATVKKTRFEKKQNSESILSTLYSEMHSLAIDHFSRENWNQTSVISFSKNSTPNPLEYAEAQGVPTLGFGAGSRSYYDTLHTSTIPYATRAPLSTVMEHYYEAVRAEKFPIMSYVELDESEEFRRRLILQMHHGKISKGLLNDHIGGFDKNIIFLLHKFVASGFFKETDTTYTLTRKGAINAAEIGLALATDKVKKFVINQSFVQINLK
jgi:oxygen-independent coproporphyrinogen-3 oxidase